MEPGFSVGETLARARDRGFVGRRAELDAVVASLDGTSPVRVHLVHGQGGIGKSTLLDACARAATRRGLAAVYVDAREIEPTAAALMSAVEERASRTSKAGGVDLLLVDGYELLAHFLDTWFRDEFVPSRPGRSVTVLAGRSVPASEWRHDAGWRELIRVHELSVLDEDESRVLLERCGVAPEAGPNLVRVGRGHPLALAMLAEASIDAPAIAQLADAPAVAAALCARVVDDVPEEAHRTGLATCAHATRMTQDLLARIVGVRAAEVWAWLESRPYVRRGEVGLFLHDVVREAFEAEFAQRSPDAYSTLHVAIRNYFLERLFDPTNPRPDRAAAEILLTHRAGPLADQSAALRDRGQLSIARAEPVDIAAIIELIRHAEGVDVAELARRYAEEQPRGIYCVRSDSGVEAFTMQVYLPTGGPLDSDDPGARAVLAAVAEHGPLRPGERINVSRFGGASGRYQGDPALLLVNGVACLLEWAREPAAWSFVITLEDEQYGPYFEYLGLRRMFEVSAGPGRQVGYGWDRRRFPFRLLSELMACRELTGETGPPPAELVRPAPLSLEEFTRAVRAALSDLGHPDRLASSPLLASALADPTQPVPAQALEATLRQAIAALDREPGGAEHRRVLARTYLHGSTSQEAAAAVLGLPFSTYRRHLARAHQRLTEVLWAVEVGQLAVEPVDENVSAE
ncbi:MAG TPA: AAA family ATPase [Actinoplanes sp.]|jgi:hypothetical protein|nr:AAA family ATPase [Actinoplanes sp.]